MFSPISEITASENTAHRRSLGNFRGFSHFAARFFYGNACAPEQSATVHRRSLCAAISAALAINGEPLTSAVATVTPAAVENYFNIYVAANVDVPKGCCVTVAMENTSAQAISFANSNMIVERVC